MVLTGIFARGLKFDGGIQFNVVRTCAAACTDAEAVAVSWRPDSLHVTVEVAVADTVADTVAHCMPPNFHPNSSVLFRTLVQFSPCFPL